MFGSSERVNELVNQILDKGVKDTLERIFGEELFPDALNHVFVSLASEWEMLKVPSPAIDASRSYQGGELTPLQFRGLVEIILDFAKGLRTVPVSESAAEMAVRKAAQGKSLRSRLEDFVIGKVIGTRLMPQASLSTRALEVYVKSFGKRLQDIT